MAFLLSLLATKDENFPKTLELFLRQSIKEFPYHHSVLFQTMVRTLSKTEIVSTVDDVSGEGSDV